MKKELVNNYKQYFKITFTIIGIIVGIILLDSIQALVFDNSPILKIRDHYNGGQLYCKDRGILVDTYCGGNGQKDTVIKGRSHSLSYSNDYQIVDITKENNAISYSTELEFIYEDELYFYYLPGFKSEFIEVRFNNGKKYNIIEALGNGYVDIGDLDIFDIDYIKKKK